MGTKAAFVTAMGGVTTALGTAQAVTAATDDKVTLAAHGLETGDGPFQFINAGGALPAGLAAETNYWAIYDTADTFKVATSEANALAGTAVDVTDTGTGTHTITATAQTVADAIEDVLTEHLVHPGNRSNDPTANVERFWEVATAAVL